MIGDSVTEVEWIDNAFCIEKARFLWNSKDKEGKYLVSALTDNACIRATRFYLKGLQEGWPEDTVRHEGTVGGKL
jgi:hypothetical protein